MNGELSGTSNAPDSVALILFIGQGAERIVRIRAGFAAYLPRPGVFPVHSAADMPDERLASL